MDSKKSVHEIRRELGLSHRRLSELSGIDVKSIREIEYGRSMSTEYEILIEVMRRYKNEMS